MILKLTPEVISFVIGSPTETGRPALFNPETYELYRADEPLPAAVSREMLMAFPRIREVDVQRAYVESLNNRTITNRFRHLTDEAFWHEFWNTFDDGGFQTADYRAFEQAFYVQAVRNWCQNNGIACYTPNSRA